MISERIVLAVRAMSESERIELAKELAPLLCPGVDMIELARAKAKASPEKLSDALRGSSASVVIKDEVSADDASDTASSKGKKKGSKRPFWLKRPTALIEGKRGGYAIEGDWVTRMGDLPNGTRVVLGTNIASVSKWAVLEVTIGGTAIIEASDDLTFTVENARVVVALTKDWPKIAGAVG